MTLAGLARTAQGIGPICLTLGAGILTEGAIGADTAHQAITSALGALAFAGAALWWFVKRELGRIAALPSPEWFERVSKLLDTVPVLEEKVKTAERFREDHKGDDDREHDRINSEFARQQLRLEALSDILRGAK